MRADIDALYPQVDSLYIDLHKNPELSLHEEKTAAKLAERMRKLGYEVTTEGRRARRRRDPEERRRGRRSWSAPTWTHCRCSEQTGLPYASKVTTNDDVGRERAGDARLRP